MSSSGETSVFLVPGMRLKVATVLETELGSRGIGFFVNPEKTISYKGKVFDLINGFAVDNPQVGSLEASSAGDVAVVYVHKRPEENFIYFFALTGEMAVVNVVAVPIHDHSSIIQGGPAYATYFNDDEIVT